MSPSMKDTAEKVLCLLSGDKDLQAEVYILDSRELTIEVAQKKVENLKLAQERGLGLRVLKGDRMGYAFSSDLGEESLKKVIASAIANAGKTEADPNWALPVGGKPYPDVDVFDGTIDHVPLEEKIARAQEIEEAARAYDPRVKLTEKAVYADSYYKVALYNSLGLQAEYEGTYCGGYCQVVAEEKNSSQSGFGLSFFTKYNDLKPAQIGREASRRAVRMLGARLAPTAWMPVVIEPYCAVSFLGVLQAAFSAEAVLKGKSYLAGREGQIVASPLLNLLDDGTLDLRLGSAPFDGEGVPTSRKYLIKEGVLQGWLHNTYTSNKMDTGMGGNAVRSSYKGTPEVGTTNFYLEPGTASPEELLADIGKGLYLTEIMGMHTANPITGDFSVGAAGLLIENGRLTTPVKGLALAGNLNELLKDIEGVGSDLEFISGKGSPTLRIKAMSISGS